ncbi:hypothetical protein BJX99DRAFT_253942 [Aspergillus californicus]
MANHADVVRATVAKGLNVPLNMVDNNMNIEDTLSADMGDVTQVTAVLEEGLMHEKLISFINTHNRFGKQSCKYGEGFTGTLRLRSVRAKHLEAHFKPAKTINEEHITFAARVTPLIEVCALLLCNADEDAIMLGTRDLL